VEGETVGGKMHKVRSVTTGREVITAIWEVDDVAILEVADSKILKSTKRNGK
jgi:hypothetical protein